MENNWYVLTGGPSAGKTLLIKALETRGVHVEHESARIIIDEGIARGERIEDIRSSEAAFQYAVHEHKRQREEYLDPGELIFFDRGMHDTLAYLRLIEEEIPTKIAHDIARTSYKKVFLLEPRAFHADYARVESEEEQARLHDLLRAVYEDAGMPVVTIPAFPTKQERIAYFLRYLEEHEGVQLPGGKPWTQHVAMQVPLWRDTVSAMDTRLLVTSVIAGVVYMGVYGALQWYRDGGVNGTEVFVGGITFVVAFYIARTLLVRWRQKRQNDADQKVRDADK